MENNTTHRDGKYCYVLWDLSQYKSVDDALLKNDFKIVFNYISIGDELNKITEGVKILKDSLVLSNKEISLVTYMSTQN